MTLWYKNNNTQTVSLTLKIDHCLFNYLVLPWFSAIGGVPTYATDQLMSTKRNSYDFGSIRKQTAPFFTSEKVFYLVMDSSNFIQYQFMNMYYTVPLQKNFQNNFRKKFLHIERVFMNIPCWSTIWDIIFCHCICFWD